MKTSLAVNSILYQDKVFKKSTIHIKEFNPINFEKGF